MASYYDVHTNIHDVFYKGFNDGKGIWGTSSSTVDRLLPRRTY